MTDTLEYRIRDIYDRLPAGERKLADVALELARDLPAYSATELAAQAGVSKATAVRLVRRLGYSDFQELRQKVRAQRKYGSPLAELSSVRGQKGTVGRHLEHDLTCLTRTMEAVRPDVALRAIKIMAEANRLWVVGFRNSYPLAFYARGLLVQAKSDVRLLPAAGQTLAEELSILKDGDAVLALAFRRRPPLLGKILKTAAEVKAGVVLLGDPSLGTVAEYADVVFRCQSRGSSLFDSYVAAMSLINYLCSGVALAAGEAGQERLRRIEHLHDDFGDFELA
jgi:DNA-binding MurR/RpiR family transcriptional regulator